MKNKYITGSFYKKLNRYYYNVYDIVTKIKISCLPSVGGK